MDISGNVEYTDHPCRSTIFMMELMDIQMIDLHCHILPGLDDGPQTMEESLEMCRSARKDGIVALVASPHALNGIHLNEPEAIRSAFESLSLEVARAGIDLEIFPGAELHVHPDIPRLLSGSNAMTINRTGKAVMIEFPEYFIANVICRFLESILARGIVPVIGHPERSPQLWDLGLLREIVQMGAVTQITALSLTGGFGAKPKALSRKYLENDLVHVIASDAHDLSHRPPLLSKSLKEAAGILGAELAARLFRDNPLAILEGRPSEILYPRRREIADTTPVQPATG